MADKANLRNMVLTFRVSELQLLLGLTSQSRCGRKTELMQRALALVERGVSTQVQLKIHELYQRFTPRSAGYSPPPAHRSMASSSSLSLSKTSTGMPSQHATMSSAAAAGRPNGVHRGLSELLIQQQRSQIPAHPDVKYKHLPFYDVIGEIMRPTSLVPRGSAKQQEARLSFCLNEQQVRDIGMSSRDSTSPDRVDFVVQVQLRFCLLDSTSRQPDVFPSNISVKVNGMPAPLPNPIPTNKPGMEPKRPSRPVDITRICRLSASVSNGMVITWNADATKNHCVAVYLVKRLDSNQLLQRLRRAGMLKTEITKQLVKDKLSLDMDTDLATTSMRVSLLCPLGKMRMTLPCRASTCNHLQCFDGPTFLQMNEKKPTWMCPVCDRPAEFNRLVIDGLFTEIIRASVDSTEIELSKDGQWHVTKTDDSDDESPCNSPNPTKSSSHAVTASTTSGEEKAEGAAAIDLTETDDEGIEQSASNSRCASATTASYTPGGTLSSPRSNSPTGGGGSHDLSPLNIPMPTPPLPPLPAASPAPSAPRGTISPPPLPPLPPMAHQSYPSSKLPNIPPPPLPPNFNGTPAAAHSSSSSRSMPYSRGHPTSYSSSGRREGMGEYGNRRSTQPDMLDYLSMVNGMSDYAVTPQYSLPSNAFDYLYAPQRRDNDLERSKGRGSPTTSS